jgi:putative effector of murein hydrolase
MLNLIEDSVLSHPLISWFVTLGSFIFAQKVQNKLGGHGLLNPVVVAIVFVIIFLRYSGLSYTDYIKNVDFINLLLGSATVALAIPLYNQLSVIKKFAGKILLAVLMACVVAAFSAYYLAIIMNASENIQLAIVGKSTTVAIAISIGEKIGAEPSLAVFFVFTTGIVGSLIAMGIFNFLRIKDERAIGLSLGATCHGLGLVKAFQHSETAGVFAALGMSLMGLFSGIILPFIFLKYIL